MFAKCYEINARASLALLFVCTAVVHSPSRVSYGSRKRIDNGRGHVGYTKIVYLLEKPASLSKCRYPIYTVDNVIVVRRSSQTAVKERLFQWARALENFVTVVRSTQISLEYFFMLFSQGDYSVHAWGDPRDPPRDPRFSSLSLSAQKEFRRAPFGSKSSQMCSKIRRAYQIGKH